MGLRVKNSFGLGSERIHIDLALLARIHLNFTYLAESESALTPMQIRPPEPAFSDSPLRSSPAFLLKMSCGWLELGPK
jgi:hypothetical protein